MSQMVTGPESKSTWIPGHLLRHLHFRDSELRGYLPQLRVLEENNKIYQQKQNSMINKS